MSLDPATLERYEPVIGLEIHTQLKTRTKMFSACPNTYGEAPNTMVDCVSLGLPGSLPVVNREAFTLAIRTGLALDASITRKTKFDRKNYYYPDLPKGYQISQLDRPIVADGQIRLPSGKTISIVRAHLEEDAGKAMHVAGTDYTEVDLNRCGIPLLEIVTGPDMRSAAEAFEYLTEMKLLLRYLGVSDCDMEKGSLRCDVNVSVRPRGQEAFGTRSELKNLNSFRAVERAIHFEIARHIGVVESGGTLQQDTRAWDDAAGSSRLMRLKETSDDYRYFPDPDLPPHEISEEWIEEIRSNMVELPAARRERYVDQLGLSAYDAGVLVQDREISDWFERVAELCGDAKSACNWITADLFGLMNEAHHGIHETSVSAEHMAELIGLVRDDTINNKTGRKVLAAMYGTGKAPKALVDELGLAQVSDEGALEEIVRRALAQNEKAVADLKAGKKKAMGAIVGFVMRETKGTANPGMVNGLVDRILAES